MQRSMLLFICLALFVSPGLKLSAQTIDGYQTTPDLLESLSRLAPLHLRTHGQRGPQAPLIAVDPSKTYQQIDGFGASLTDAAAWLFAKKLPPDVTNSAFQLLFNRKDGIGLTFLRQPIGSSDLAATFYSYDDLCKQSTTACTTPAGTADPDLTHFSLAHDQEYILPLLRKALAVNPDIKIMLTPWSPPGWMKTNGSMLGTDPATKQPATLRPEFYNAFANYLVKTIQGYQAAGVPVYALSVQNEPLYPAPTYSGMSMPAAQQAAFLGDALAPAMAAAHLNTKVLVYDHNWDHPEYPATVLSDAKAGALAAGTAWHNYAGDPAAMTAFHEKFPSKDEWETEASGGTWQKGSIITQEAAELIAVMRNWSRSYVLWAIATDQDHGPHVGGCGTCRGVITLDISDPDFPRIHREPDYYVLGQASAFVLPGAVRIASTEPDGTSLKDVAFRNPDGEIVLYTLNTGTVSQVFRIGFEDKTTTTILPAGSIATFIWKPRP
ncbi:MAG TPA: glycoside hydrolase family 30 beta sandwich domain-containing protein [Terracidiphilus sp.]|nr:glycoside hydrolase family 30 beta sandwich domain-containing protein [Terracidiphilus sp.]